MNKALTSIIVLALLFLAITFFYVFELPPLNPGGPFIGAQTQQSQNSEEIPDALKEGIIRGKNEQELVNAGKKYFAEKDYLKARISFEQVTKFSPENIDAHVMLARTYIAERKIADALKVLDRLTIHNQLSKYYQGLLSAYGGDHERTKNLLRESITIGTTVVGGNAEVVERAKIVLGAYDEFSFNLGGTPHHLNTLLGRSFNQIGEYDLAIPFLINVIKSKKDYRDAWIFLGYAYLKTEKYQDALESFEAARKLDPEKPETSFFLGLTHFALQDLQKAVQFLELAKTKGYEPRIQVEQKLAEIYLQMKEFEKSAASYENVLSLNNRDVNYFIRPIWIYLDQLNQPEKALTLAGKAVAAHPDKAMSFNLLGWASIGANRLEEAQKYLDRAQGMDPNLDALYLNYGRLAEKKNDIERAVSYYKRAYEIGKGNAIAAAAAERFNRLIENADGNEYAHLKASVLSAE